MLPAMIVLAGYTHAQTIKKSELTGTWHMMRMEQNGNVMLDAHDLKAMVGTSLKYARKRNAEISATDSMEVVERCSKLQKQIDKMYFVFTAKGQFLSPKYSHSGDTFTGGMDTGSYTYNEKTGVITTKLHDVEDELRASYKNNILTLKAGPTGEMTFSMMLRK